MTQRKVGLLVAVAVFIVAGFAVLGNLSQAALQGEGGKGGASAGRYSVVFTEGHNLIVTDNNKNTLYFYTIDKDQPIGSDLKLRGSVDLTQVGKAVIRPSTLKKKKVDDE
jgi:hypothetical protein